LLPLKFTKTEGLPNFVFMRMSVLPKHLVNGYFIMSRYSAHAAWDSRHTGWSKK